jgi:4-amino-4-deoxy-L-arabinose transferase-like glycosyltransferase
MDDSLQRLRQTTQASDLRIPTPGGTAGSHAASSSARRLRVPRGWPLLIVLLVQAALSLLLLRADTAFEDEATYLWAGHLEIAHWLHGTPVPVFQSYFSGAPVIYPPLGAVADSIGGLLAARILSLGFMLLATVLLWSCARRLFGRQAAFFAAALFAVLGPTLHLGAFATYDALSVFLISLAAWFVVRAADTRNATGWLVAAGASLAVANAAAYSSALFDVVVIVLALLIPMRELGVKLAASRCLTVLIVAAVLLGAGLLIGGSTYAHGIDVTTLERVPETASAATVLIHAWSWTGVVVVVAVCGIAISWLRHEGGTQTWLLVLLAAAAVLGPLEQGRLHTVASLDKHVAAGVWFAALAAGYAVDKLIAAAAAGSSRTVTSAACVIALALPVSLGVSQSRSFSTSWPKSTSLVAILGPLVARTSGPLLVEDPSIAEYYLHDENHWKRWSSTRNIRLRSGASSGGPSKAAGIVGGGDAGTYAAKIASGYFSLVALNFADTTSLDHQIRKDLSRNKQYHLVQVVPYGPIPGTKVFGTYVIWRRVAAP